MAISILSIPPDVPSALLSEDTEGEKHFHKISENTIEDYY